MFPSSTLIYSLNLQDQHFSSEGEIRRQIYYLTRINQIFLRQHLLDPSLGVNLIRQHDRRVMAGQHICLSLQQSCFPALNTKHHCYQLLLGCFGCCQVTHPQRTQHDSGNQFVTRLRLIINNYQSETETSVTKLKHSCLLQSRDFQSCRIYVPRS